MDHAGKIDAAGGGKLLAGVGFKGGFGVGDHGENSLFLVYGS
jgi:hypothetical protein